MGKLAAGQQQYYLDAVARGVEDYYTGSGEAPGEWIGSASAELDLADRVEDVDLHAVLSGLDPRTLESLVRGQQKVPGFDLTFSAPKSVSLVWALSQDQAVAAAVVDAHDGAVRSAIAWLEGEGCFGRRGRQGLQLTKGSGFVAAAFRHRTSRAGDPQLHTHVLVANLVHGEDGRWSALDARHLYALAKTAGTLYRAELRDRLTRSLGVAWTEPERGLAEIAGVPQPVLREFSQRRREIETAMAQRGVGGARAAQVAALDTRRSKTYTVDESTMAAAWQARAERMGFGPERVADLLDSSAPAVPREIGDDELAHELVVSESSFTKGDVLQALAAHARDGKPIAEVDRRADAFLRSPEVVELERQPTGARYTTRTQLALEQHVLDTALAAQNSGLAVVDEATVNQTVSRARDRELSREQQRMVRHLTTSGNGVDVVVGVAGSGKTTALATARAAWAASGIPVVGAALSARAAAELEAGSGIPSTTLASFITALEGPVTRVPAGGVVVVDEAGMVGTRDIARVLDIVARDRAKVVLVGDHRQLPEIEAGGAFAALAHHLDALTLTDNRRQSDRRHRKTLRHLRHGNPARALNDLAERGDLVSMENRAQVVGLVINDWHQAREGGGEVLMLAARRSVVRELNDAARDHLRIHGQLGADQLAVDGIGFAVGDRVIALRNDRRLGVRNGDRGVITAIHAPGGSDHVSAAVSVRVDDSRTVVLPGTYVDAGHLDHGYATTIHKAQGATVDHALVVADHTLAREGAYVALSRGRHTNRLYATTTDLADDLTLESTHGGRRTWNLLSRLQRRAEKHLALDLDHRPTVGRGL